jgi:peptidoglycan/LPS O-acetylase OafA/YrhL
VFKEQYIMTISTPRAAHLPHIDALRATAVLAVLLYHLDVSGLPGGFAGVDVFFVISGFVVSKAAGSRNAMPLGVFAVDFFARRVRRIIPPLVVCLVVTALITALLIPPSWLSDSIPRTGRYAFFGFGNLVLARTGNQYFSPLAEFNPFTHTWSLGVEEQFYLLFPFVFMMWLRGGRWRIVCVAIVVLGTVCSFLHAVDMSAAGRSEGYYLLASRYWELAAGVLLYFVWSSPLYQSFATTPRHRSIRLCLLAISLAMLLWSILNLEPSHSPGYGTLVPVVAGMLLIAMLDVSPGTMGEWISQKLSPLAWLGRLSYSLYLWHWPVIVLFKWTVGLSGPWLSSMAVVLSFALAWVSWRFVERPFRAPSSGARESGKKTIFVGIVAVSVGAAIAHAAQRNQARFSFSTVARASDDWYPSRGQKLADDRGCKVAPFRTDLAAGWRIAYRRLGCEGATSAPRVFAIGDSHALAYGPAFASYALTTGGAVTVYNNGGCPFLSLQPWREENEDCRRYAAAALADLLPKLGSGDVVFLPSLRLPRFVDQWIVHPDEMVRSLSSGTEALLQRRMAADRAAETLARLRMTGAKVVLQAPAPILKAPPFRCVDWWTKSNDICAGGTRINRAEFLALRSSMLEALQALAENDDGVTLFDPAEALCPQGENCEAFEDHRPLFFDGDHISGYGNSVLAPHLTAAMKRAVGK